MDFSNYCIVVFGDVMDSKEKINKISENEPKYLTTTDVLIGTFCTIATPSELKEYMKMYNKNFLLFEIDEDKSSWNFNESKYSQHLFSFLSDSKKISDEFKKSIEKEFGSISLSGHSMDIGHADDDTPFEEKINKILDKGENISENDKEILYRIVNNKENKDNTENG